MNQRLQTVQVLCDILYLPLAGVARDASVLGELRSHSTGDTGETDEAKDTLSELHVEIRSRPDTLELKTL